MLFYRLVLKKKKKPAKQCAKIIILKLFLINSFNKQNRQRAIKNEKKKNLRGLMPRFSEGLKITAGLKELRVLVR